MENPLASLVETLPEGKHAPKKRGRPPKVPKPMNPPRQADALLLAALNPPDDPAPAPPAKRSRKRQKTNSTAKEKEDKPIEYYQLRAYGQSKYLQEALKAEGISINLKTLRHMPVSQMQEVLEDIAEALDRQMSNSVIDESVQMGMNVLEELLQAKTPLKPRGATSSMWNDPKWLALYERFKIDHDLGIRPMNPTMDLLMSTVAIVKESHNANVGTVHRAVDLTKPSKLK